jgi:hypothetical protein
MTEKITETDEAMVAVLKLLISAAVVENPKRQTGLDQALVYLREQLRTKGSKKAAALIEAIRLESTAEGSQPALLNILRKPAEGSA